MSNCPSHPLLLIFCIEQTEYDALIAISSGQKSPTIEAQIAECSDESIWDFIKEGWEEYGYEPWVVLLEEKRCKEKPGVSEGTIMVRKPSTYAKDQASKIKPAQAAGSVHSSTHKRKAPEPKAVESEEEIDIDEDDEDTTMVMKLSTHTKDKALKVKPAQAAGSVHSSMRKKKSPVPNMVESEEEVDVDEDVEVDEEKEEDSEETAKKTPLKAKGKGKGKAKRTRKMMDFVVSNGVSALCC